MKRYQKKRSKWKNPGIMAAAAVVLVLAGVLTIYNGQLQKVEYQVRRQVQELEEQVAQESKRAEELEEYQIYVQTREYIEQVAREQLGLVNPDESVVKPKE